jgi:hypothetical protein
MPHELHIPSLLVAFLGPPALWGKAVWASPYLKTRRRGLSGLLSIVTGLLSVVAIQGYDPGFRIWLTGAAISMAAMLTALLWPPLKHRS